MNNQGNSLLSKDHNNPPACKFKEMEFCHISDKEFKVAVWGNSMSDQKVRFNEIWKTIPEQNETFSENGNNWKEPNRNLSTEEPWRITELKISIEEFSGRLDRAEERISVFKHKSFEIIQRNGKGKKKKVEWSEKSLRDLGNIIN